MTGRPGCRSGNERTAWVSPRNTAAAHGRQAHVRCKLQKADFDPKPTVQGSVERSLLARRAALEGACDQLALVGERTRRHRVTGSFVPISCIREITFFPMQIGMDPSALTICFVDLNKVMSLTPVPTSVPPDGLQR